MLNAQEHLVGISTLSKLFPLALLLAGLSLPCQAAEAPRIVDLPAAETGHFLDVQALLKNRTDTTGSPLLTGVNPPTLEPRTSMEDYHVSSATLTRGQNQPGGFIVLVNRDDGSFLALVETQERSGLVTGKADGPQTFREHEKRDFLENDMLPAPASQTGNEMPQTPPDNRTSDAVITMQVGLSTAAAAYVGDTKAFALAQLETVNMGLRNSGVTGVRVDLAEVAVSPVNPPMVGTSLGLLKDLFPNYARANLSTGFFMPTDQDSAGGWGFTGGRETIQHVNSGTAFRHEVGHNAGGSHCNQGENSYNFGHSNGTYKTIQCGNNLPYYSTPTRSATDGSPLGNARTADMARKWRVDTLRMTSYNSPSLPFTLQSIDQPSECVDVLDGKFHEGARVGLWACNLNNPNQRWDEIRIGNKVMLRLHASPTLCLTKGRNDGPTREVVLSRCHEGDAWEDPSDQFRVWGNSEFLYLFREHDNSLSATSNASTHPATRWLKKR